MKAKKILLIGIFFILLYGCVKQRQERIQDSMEQAKKLAIDGNYREALKFLEEHIKEKDRDTCYYLYHGLYQELDDVLYYLPRYHEDYLKAYELDPENYDVLLRLGLSCELLNDYEKAVSYLEEAVRLSPQSNRTDSNPYGSLAIAYLETGHYEKAYNTNEYAISLSPDNAWNYLRKGLILSHLKGLNPLVEYYKKACYMDPENIEFPKYYGNRLIEMGLYDLAIEHFNKFLAIDEEYYWAYADLGYIKMAQGDLEGGKSLLDKATAIFSNDPLILKYLGFYYHFSGLEQESYDYYSKYRLSMEKSVVILKIHSEKEFIDYFSDDALFRILEKVYTD